MENSAANSGTLVDTVVGKKEPADGEKEVGCFEEEMVDLVEECDERVGEGVVGDNGGVEPQDWGEFGGMDGVCEIDEGGLEGS
jgi:hypothetical protein